MIRPDVAASPCLRVWALTAVVAMCAAAACTGGAARTQRSPASTAPPAVGQTGIAWTSCGDQLECAKVPVPLDWNQPDGKHIELAVIRHLASKPQEPGALSYGDLLLTTFTPPRDPKLWPQYARYLDEAANGDASELETAARGGRTPTAYSKATTSAAIQCLEGPARQPSSAWPDVVGHLTDLSALWGPVLGWWQWAPCASSWPALSTDRYTGPWNAKTSTPILLINTRYDPATSYRNAQVAEGRLGNAVLLTLAGYGHPSYQLPSECIDKARLRYLVDLVTPQPGTVCPADRAPFQAASGQPEP